MKKITNKIVIVIAGIFLFIGAFNVYAVTTNNQAGTIDPDSKYVTDTATLSVEGVVSTDQFSAYKVLDTYYNATTNIVSYEFTKDFSNFLKQSDTYKNYTVDDYYKLTSGNITSGSTKTTSTLDKLVSAYASYIKKNSIQGTTMNVSGTTVTQTLQAGSYLVLPTSTTKVYAVMVGNLDLKESNGNWAINSANIVAKVSEAGITKAVSEEGYQEGTFNIGKEFTYVIKGTVPAYPTNATNKTYTIKDTMSTGLDFSGVESVIIQDGETTLTTASNGTVTNASGQTVATITIDGKNMTINFDVNNVTSTIVTITYKAKLNENAVLGASGNTNSANLTYSNDPYGTGTYTTETKNTTVYTYGLELLKYASGEKTPLQGAEFEIYSDSTLKTKVGTIKTNDDGTGTFKGLAEGTYYLKEVKAPTGYQLLKDAITIKIGPNGNLEEDAGYYTVEVANTKVGLLPSTGSIGTIALTGLGVLIICGGIYLFLAYKKKNKQQEG